MFMKIDANADGTVDWDEFSSFMLLQNQGKQNMRHHETHAEYHDKPFDVVRCPTPHPPGPPKTVVLCCSPLALQETEPWGLESRRLESRPKASVRLDLEVSAGWALTSRRHGEGAGDGIQRCKLRI
jgi:hypothetical protein